jgi:hypothetical protein
LSDEKSKTNVEHAIRSMAKVSMFEGRLNDIQLLNIRQYAFLFFDGVTSARIDYDLTPGKPAVTFEQDVDNFDLKYNIEKPKNNTKIYYFLTIDEMKNDRSGERSRRFPALRQAIDNLLWKGIDIQVYFNDVFVYGSKHGE